MKMQSSRLPTALHEILKNKIQETGEMCSKIIEAAKSMATQKARVEEQVNNLVLAENYTATEVFTVAMCVDELLERMMKCHQALSCLTYEPGVLRTADVLKEATKEYGQTSQTYESEISSTTRLDNNFSSLIILKDQMEILQQQVTSLQESHDIQLQKLEFKAAVLENDYCNAEKGFNVKLHHVDAKTSLLQDVQLRDNTSIKNVVSELSSLRIGVMSMQDCLTRLDEHQIELQEKIKEVTCKTDDLVKLRKILNEFHMNVTKREELTQKCNQLEEEITTVKCVFNSFVDESSKDTEENQDGQAIIPAFVALASEKQIVKPGNTICFTPAWQEWDSYDPDTSIFTAPVGGKYLFSTSINADSEGMLSVSVIANGNEVAFCGTSGKKDEQTSTLILLRLSPGDKVWIEAEKQTHPEGVAVGRGFSNFIGCCLK